MIDADARIIRKAIEVLSRVLNNVDSSATVEISVAELQRLHDCERKTKRRIALPFLMCPRSRINRDEEVALFIAERAGRLLLREIVEECESAFGPKRTPSKSAVHLFIGRLYVSPAMIRLLRPFIPISKAVRNTDGPGEIGSHQEIPSNHGHIFRSDDNYYLHTHRQPLEANARSFWIPAFAGMTGGWPK